MNIIRLFKRERSTLNLKKFLAQTNNLVYRPRIICKDGFQINVEASKIHYCFPQEDGAENYKQVELARPSSLEKELLQYAEDVKNPLKTWYNFVPVKTVNKLLKKHGGIIGFDINSI